jgi:hypothetical protein
MDLEWISVREERMLSNPRGRELEVFFKFHESMDKLGRQDPNERNYVCTCT